MYIYSCPAVGVARCLARRQSGGCGFSVGLSVCRVCRSGIYVSQLFRAPANIRPWMCGWTCGWTCGWMDASRCDPIHPIHQSTRISLSGCQSSPGNKNKKGAVTALVHSNLSDSMCREQKKPRSQEEKNPPEKEKPPHPETQSKPVPFPRVPMEVDLEFFAFPLLPHSSIPSICFFQPRLIATTYVVHT